MNRYSFILLVAVLFCVTSSVIVRVNGASNTPRKPRAPLPPLSVGQRYTITVEPAKDVKTSYIGKLIADENERLVIETPLQQVQKTASLGFVKNVSVARQQLDTNVAVYKSKVAFVGPAPPQ